MKCSKCGEECKDNQAFCLKCGNPIQVVPDFNLIEAELASNIGELMDEMDKQEEEEPKPDEEELKVEEMDISDMELKLVNISRKQDSGSVDGKTKIIGDINKLAREENLEQARTEKNSGKSQGTGDKAFEEDSVGRNNKSEKKKKKSKGKLVAVIAIIIVLLAAAVAAFVWFAGRVDNATTSYDEYYNSAKEAYDKMDTKAALEAAYNALGKTGDTNSKTEVRKLLYDIYILAGDKSEDYADNLTALLELGTSDPKYYVALAEYYDENKKYNNLTAFLAGIEDEAILEKLSAYIVEVPKVDMEPGNYDEYIAVTLTAAEGCTISYTTDSRNPSQYGEDYKGAIQIAEEGEFVIKAVAIDAKGVESKIVTYTYNIELSGSDTPKITPTGGEYSDYTKIMVDVPEGGKAYYTWDEKTPTDASEEYDAEKGIEMLRGINVLKVVILDKYGIYSKVATESYNLQIERALTLNEAVDLIQSEADKELPTTEEETEETEAAYTASVSYDKTVIIDNQEYYIITASMINPQGEADKITIYAVNTYDKSINKAIDANGEYQLEGNAENN